MEKPKIEDFEIKSHDCWGVTEFRTDWVGYAQALEKYIENIKPHLPLGGVSGRSEQFVCLCPRDEIDNCDRKEPCKECETCPYLRQTNCH